MKKIKGLLVATLFCATAAFAQNNAQITSLAIGSQIPKAAEKMQTVSGGNVSLTDVKTSKGLLVMFSCNTCPYVVKSQARTLEMMNYASSQGIGMVIINSNEAYRTEDDSYEAMKKYSRAQGYKVPYVVDKQATVADAFGATRTPEVFLFDGQGKLVYKGAMEDNPANPGESTQLFLKQAIDNMAANKPVDPATTKSIGCSIKRKS
ncbi:MAG: thioredoxin family protein [Sphingobacteriales bacterium]|nr:MAG: thioredoxin family protein [Sphingobacteriales bacterium]